MAVIAVFVVLQLLTLNYGTRINDVPYISEGQVNADAIRGSGFERSVLVEPTSTAREGLDLWLLRFKLYSVEADEVVSIIALARIRPQEWRLDPGFYQYGGAYLYPLGLWFFTLERLGMIKLGTLPELLKDPERMDRVWVYGRAFVLVGFTVSAVLLFLLLRHVATPAISLLLLAIYLACPASVALSQVIKPHWYALLWTNLALWIFVRAYVRRRLTAWQEIVIGLSLGLAVGSALTFSLFAILIWVGLMALVSQRTAPLPCLVRVPAVAIIVFGLANPYYFLNWRGVLEERGYAADWFRPTFDVRSVLLFIDNSAFAGLGIALTLSVIVVLVWRLVRPRWPAERALAAAIVIPALIIAGLTASMATWHTNIRYAAYVLPLALLLLALADWPRRVVTLGIVLMATVAQAVPLKLAYFDENEPELSTRLQAAAWVDANIPPGESLCLNSATPSPYEIPPFRLERYDFATRPCQWKVLVERETDSVVADPEYGLVKRFRPRLSPEGFPLVFGHINPQISIYRRV